MLLYIIIIIIMAMYRFSQFNLVRAVIGQFSEAIVFQSNVMFLSLRRGCTVKVVKQLQIDVIMNNFPHNKIPPTHSTHWSVYQLIVPSITVDCLHEGAN